MRIFPPQKRDIFRDISRDISAGHRDKTGQTQDGDGTDGTNPFRDVPLSRSKRDIFARPVPTGER